MLSQTAALDFRAAGLRVSTALLIPLVVCVLFSLKASGSTLDDIGFTQLELELGGAIPTGASVTVSHVEALLSDNYLPNTGGAEFAGKTFNVKSDSSGISSHATTVGRFLYGIGYSVTPDVSTIDSWEANDWLQSGFLRTNSNSEPRVETRDIQNHSWGGNFVSPSDDTDALRRLDYTINRDNYLAVVATFNGSGSSIPNLLAHSYNTITVGRSDGIHGHGFTSIDGAGRIKPEIVVPASVSSWAAPIVSASGGLLLDAARADSALAGAENSETLKAILLAGATKHEFSDWDRTTTRPLDDVYGAGELNIYNSYNVLIAGEHEASASSDVSTRGWDFDTTTASSKFYFFEVPADNAMIDLSAVLTWNREITDGDNSPVRWRNPESSLADMNMQLYTADAYTIQALIDSSASTVDNIEHVYQQHLDTGRYAIELTSDTTATDFALAWSSMVARLGDINFDGGVDVNDLIIWKENRFTSGQIWQTGDLDGDGDTDVNDLIIWKSYRFTSNESLSAETATTPEPVSAAIFALGALAMLRRKRRCS